MDINHSPVYEGDSDNDRMAKQEIERKELNAEEERFVELLARGYNQAAACKEMLIERKQGKEIFQRPHVRVAIQDRRQELMNRLGNNREMVLNVIKAALLADPTELFDENQDMKPFDEIPEQLKMCISQVEFKKSMDKFGVPITSTKVVMMDKMKALDMLARYFDIFNAEKEKGDNIIKIGWK